MTVVIRFQPGLRPMIQKHETHDQSTHGSWAGGSLDTKKDLAIQAKQFNSFEEFSRAVSLEGLRPRAWHITDKKNFNPSQDVKPMSRIGLPSQESILFVGDPATWQDYASGRKVAVEYDLTNLKLNIDFASDKSGNQGFYIEESAYSKLKKVGEFSIERAISRASEQQKQMPESKDEALSIWQNVQKHAMHDQSSHGNWAGTKGGSVGLDAMPYEWNPKFKEKERLTSSELSSKELNLGREQLQQVATSPITIRVESQKMKEIIKDGRFKSFDEQPATTNPSETNYREGRFDLEKGLWGLPTDSLSPIYGYFDTPLQSGLDNTTTQYGDIKVVLKDSVAGRTTISPGDSANHGLTPVLVTDARKGNLSLEQVDSAYRSRHFQRNYTSVSQPIRSVRPIGFEIDYFEAQVHGGVSLSDIKSVRLKKYSIFDSSQIALLEKAGIEVTRDNE